MKDFSEINENLPAYWPSSVVYPCKLSVNCDENFQRYSRVRLRLFQQIFSKMLQATKFCKFHENLCIQHLCHKRSIVWCYFFDDRVKTAKMTLWRSSEVKCLKWRSRVIFMKIRAYNTCATKGLSFDVIFLAIGSKLRKWPWKGHHRL